MNTPSTQLDHASHLDHEVGGTSGITPRQRFLLYLYSSDSTPLEWLFAAIKTGWGLWLILPMHTFAAAPHVYRFAGLLPEWWWGAAFAVLGRAQWQAWYVDDRLTRWRLALVGTIAWIIWGGLLWASDHRSSALALYAILALFQGLAAVWLYGKSHTGPNVKQVWRRRGGRHECPPSQ